MGFVPFPTNCLVLSDLFMYNGESPRSGTIPDASWKILKEHIGELLHDRTNTNHQIRKI